MLKGEENRPTSRRVISLNEVEKGGAGGRKEERCEGLLGGRPSRVEQSQMKGDRDEGVAIDLCVERTGEQTRRRHQQGVRRRC